MTLYQFNALKKPEQYDTVWREGVFLADRIDNNDKYLLYQINSFYAEIQYSAVENKIVSLKSFQSTTLLEPYLEKMEIDL